MDVPEEFRALLALHPSTKYWDDVLKRIVECTPEPVRHTTEYYERRCEPLLEPTDESR